MMSYKKLEKSKIKKILVITLSNIGDVVLTLPVMDILRDKFPQADLSVVVGPKAKSLFEENPNIEQLYVYDKRQAVPKTISMVLKLRRQKYDLVVDVRNSAIPVLISPKYRTPLRVKKVKGEHMRSKHLNRLRSLMEFNEDDIAKTVLHVSDNDKKYIDGLINENINPQEKFVVISPGAADSKKRWHEKGFVEVGDKLVQKYNVKVFFVGDVEDRRIVQNIVKQMDHPTVNLCGRTTLPQLAYLMKQCALAIVNDSAPMHIASYVDAPVIALFGPTDSVKYGPWSSQSHLVEKRSKIEPSIDPVDKADFDYMSEITSEDVLGVISLDSTGVVFNQ